MTADKDFKRLVRVRSRRNGESYASARRALLIRSGISMTTARPDGDELVEVVVEGVNAVRPKVPFLLLKETAGERRLLVFLRDREAAALHYSMPGARTVRPMPHDALTQVLDVLGGRLDRIEVGYQGGSDFTADVRVILPAGDEHHFDWRLTDAVAVALRCTPSPAILVPASLLVEPDRLPPIANRTRPGTDDRRQA